LYEAINTQNLSSIEDFMATDFVDHTRKIRGLEALKQFGSMLFNAFPDFHETTEDYIAEGSKVWVRTTITATHKGEYRGLAPTGNKFKEASVDIFRIVDGKIAEGWNVQDELDFLKKLGLIEYTEKGKKLLPNDVS
jgi:predicted ester cyclase